MTTVDDIIIMMNLPINAMKNKPGRIPPYFLLHFFRPFRFRNGTIFGLACKASLEWAPKRNPIKCVTKIERQREISVKIIRDRHPSQKHMTLMFNVGNRFFLISLVCTDRSAYGQLNTQSKH